MKALLIPSAVLIPKEMRKSFGDIPTCLFPFNGKAMLSNIYDKYKNIVDEVYVVSHRRSDLIERYIRLNKLPIHCIYIDELKDLGYTVQCGIQYITQHIDLDYLYINYADSLLEDYLPTGKNDFSYYFDEEMDDSWTWFDDNHGKILSIYDKGNFAKGAKPSTEYKHLFIGVFGIQSPKDFLDYLIFKTSNRDIDSFYEALWGYSHKNPINFIKTVGWFDVGHNENYIKAKTKVAARAFNSIQIDEERGILTKTSSNKEKLINEIRWYLRLPATLQYLIPRIYNYSLDYDSPYVSMEYYGYHTLHESLIYGNLSTSEWTVIFNKLLFAINDMQTFRIEGRDTEKKVAIIDMYLEKTKQRLKKLRAQDAFTAFFSNEIVINGVKYPSLDDIVCMLPQYINNILLKKSDINFSIIHGDLCFTNILMEDNYNFMRIIDPRGKFGRFDIYGDSRYELAKILHSLEGNYDYIIEDLFDISVNNTSITYTIHQGNSNAIQAFYKVFSEQLKNIQSVRLIEATLFLSMVPLHSDYITRQYVMLAIGVELFSKVVNGGKVDE